MSLRIAERRQLITGVLIVVAAGVVAALETVGARRIGEVATWPVTEARVIGASLERSLRRLSVRTRYTHRLEYRYEVAGVEYSGECPDRGEVREWRVERAAGAALPRVGAAATVSYDPEAPQRCARYRPLVNDHRAGFALILSAILAVFGVGLVASSFRWA